MHISKLTASLTASLIALATGLSLSAAPARADECFLDRDACSDLNAIGMHRHFHRPLCDGMCKRRHRLQERHEEKKNAGRSHRWTWNVLNRGLTAAACCNAAFPPAMSPAAMRIIPAW